MASPLAHQTGFMYGLMMPIMLRAGAVLQDTWEPRRVIGLIQDEGATFTMASTPFLTDLAKAAQETGQRIPTLRTFLCAGAPIPGALVERSEEHTSELQSLMRISYAVFCLKQKKQHKTATE